MNNWCLKKGFLFMLSVAFLAGCGSSRGALDDHPVAAPGFPDHSSEQVLQNLNNQPLSIDAYESESALSVRSPVQSGSYSASITHRKNDSLLISISPGFGILAVQALVTPDSFYVHDRINKELAVGTIQDMQRMLPLPADSEALYNAMLGIWVPESVSNWELSAQKSYYILKKPDNRYSIFVDPVFWRIIRYVENDAAGKLVEERTFSEFEDFGGIYLPRRLTFRRPGDDTSASLFHRKLTINPSSPDFDFHVSASTKRINF